MIDYIIVNITCNICLRHGKSISSDWESCCQSGFWVMWLNKMIEFFFPNSRARLSTFHKKCPDGCHFAQIGSHFAQNTTPNSIVTHPFLGDMYIHTTPPSPSKNTHFPALNLKVGKMNYSLGNLDPDWAKVGKPFLEVGKRNLLVFISIRNIGGNPWDADSIMYPDTGGFKLFLRTECVMRFRWQVLALQIC